ncbi:prolyl hydroxylase family protein [Sphingomonas radiodurans]|uniref:prolyl hydroxylase family protein n=1 Tax=Sphingomonas radiodurans TaxID=2890321 RepID=UPI001E52B115|nr:2OG-Fe(II) oxygenase [Sphingomonas radiodurans]WBH16286.1 2OG-Fe(II) oxygenase [Sphingomonas radiodurans]
MQTNASPALLDDAASGLDPASVVARLNAQPGIQRVPSPKLTLFVKRGFLDPDTCAGLVAMIDARRRPSTITDSNGDTAFRTSETCDLDPAAPLVLQVEAAIREATGIEGVFGEPLQGQRYAVGQEFKAHTDYFEPNGLDYHEHCAVPGNRTWTVMVYLNEPEAGGATRFKAVDKTIQPETGKLVAWNNRRPDRSLNPATIHHGMKVRAGVKYVITKWFRERPWG